MVQDRDGAAGGLWIGGIGLDRDRHRAAAHQIALEIRGEADDELHLAARQGTRCLILADAAEHVEIATVLHRRDEGARRRTGLGNHHGRRQVFRIRIDGEAEQHQLQDRNADDHAEGQPVAA